jgi:hypothetical protein
MANTEGRTELRTMGLIELGTPSKLEIPSGKASLTTSQVKHAKGQLKRRLLDDPVGEAHGEIR